MIYESNPKHRDPWQRGRRGSLCPRDITLERAQELLTSSLSPEGKPHQRFSTDGTRAFRAQQHSPQRWHGYPVGWDEVPPKLVATWLEAGLVDRRTVKRRRPGEAR